MASSPPSPAPRAPYNISGIAIIFVVPILVAAAALAYGLTLGFSWLTPIVVAFGYVAMAISITAGYHRLFSHRAYEAARPLRWLFALVGGASCQGDVVSWVHRHRRHHAHTDTHEDPHSIREGFLWAHWLWMTLKRPEPEFLTDPRVRDIVTDRFLVWQHRHYGLQILLTNIAAPLALGFAIGRPLEMLLAVWIAQVIQQQSTFFINSATHTFGKNTYNTSTSARDPNWLTAWLLLPLMGEQHHGYHHKWCTDYRNGVRWYHFDPTKWLIFSLSKLGLAWNLKRIPAHVIEKARLNVQIDRLDRRLSGRAEWAETRAWLEQVKAQAVARVRELDELRQQRGARARHSLRQQRDQARRAFRRARRRWRAALLYARNLQPA